MGFQNFKLKLSGDFVRDLSKIDVIRSLKNKDLKIRVDANKLWDESDIAYSYLSNLNYEFFAIEEPLNSFSYDSLLQLSEKLGIKIILDECFTRIEDINYFSENRENFILNIRISKMGGVLRSLDIAKKAFEEDINCIIGSHVGETTILSRAALLIASTYNHNVIAQEGAFGDYLLVHDICNPSMKFGKGGMIDVTQYLDNKIKGFGLNITL